MVGCVQGKTKQSMWIISFIASEIEELDIKRQRRAESQRNPTIKI